MPRHPLGPRRRTSGSSGRIGWSHRRSRAFRTRRSVGRSARPCPGRTCPGCSHSRLPGGRATGPACASGWVGARASGTPTGTGERRPRGAAGGTPGYPLVRRRVNYMGATGKLGRVLEVGVAGRVLVCSERADALLGALKDLGLVPIHVPLVKTLATNRSPPVPVPAQVLVSSAAAPRLVPQLAAWCGEARVVAVGPATARALANVGIDVAATGGGGGREALDLLDSVRSPTVFVGALHPAPELAQALALGQLVHWAVYDRVEPDARAALARALPLDAVILSSPSAVSSWMRQRPDGSAGVLVVVIGPTSAQAAREAGLGVDAMADHPGAEALARATAALFGE